MARTSAKAKKSKQEVTKKKEEAKQREESQTDSEGAGESTDKENDSTNYDVEKITHTRIFKGKRQYLVRWKGYAEDNDTWENESALQSCKEILDAFKKEHLAEANSGDEDAEEEKEEKTKPKGKKALKKKKSGRPSAQKVEEKGSELRSEEEPEAEETIEVKGKSKGKSTKKVEEDVEEESESEKNSKKKGSKGNKRKSAKQTEESSKAKKTKKDDSDDESVTDGKDYEVEKILEVHTRKDGSREFLIRWKGYRPSDDTWEPEAHLDCQELIEKFMGKVDKAKGVTRKELRQPKETKRFVPLNTRRVNQRNSGLRPCYTETYED